MACLAMAVFLAGCAKDVVETSGSIYGIVNDADNGEPVGGAHVALNPGGLTANTGSDGRYEFDGLEPGQYTVQISKSGYKTNSKRISVVAGQQASGDMVLERGEARIRLSTNTLSFAQGETSKTFEVMNVGTSGDVSWSIRKTDAWLSVDPAQGTTGQGKNSAVVVTIDRTQITEDVSTNLLVEGDGESMCLWPSRCRRISRKSRKNRAKRNPVKKNPVKRNPARMQAVLVRPSLPGMPRWTWNSCPAPSLAAPWSCASP